MSWDQQDDGGLQMWAEVGEKQALDTCLPKTYRTPLGTEMPQLHEMLPSKYLKKEDVDQDYIVTVKSIDKMNLAKPGEPDEMKWTISFQEFDKPLVANTTILNALSQACLSTNTDDWIKKEVILYVDPNVTFGGKVVGGLRVKANRPAPATLRRAAPQANPQSLDPNVTFGGKVVGGLRVKANRPAPATLRRAAPQANPQSLQDMDSDIPF